MVKKIKIIVENKKKVKEGIFDKFLGADKESPLVQHIRNYKGPEIDLPPPSTPKGSVPQDVLFINDIQSLGKVYIEKVTRILRAELDKIDKKLNTKIVEQIFLEIEQEVHKLPIDDQQKQNLIKFNHDLRRDIRHYMPKRDDSAERLYLQKISNIVRNLVDRKVGEFTDYGHG